MRPYIGDSCLVAEGAPRIYLALVGETCLPGRVTALCPYQPPAVSAAPPATSSSPAPAPCENRRDTHCEAGEGHAGAAASTVSGSSSGEGVTQHEGTPQPPAALSRLLVGVGRRLVSYRLDPAARAGKAGTAAVAAAVAMARVAKPAVCNRACRRLLWQWTVEP